MKPYKRQLRHDIFERRKDYRLRSNDKREITIPKKLSNYVLNNKMMIWLWINQKKKLEIAGLPFDLKKTNGIVFLRRILTNGHSYSFVIPPTAYDTLENIYDVSPISEMRILVNSRGNLEFTPIGDFSTDRINSAWV